jgi:hypothetical protein
MKKENLVLLLVISILSSSCATIMLGTTQEVSISSNPTGALVTNNGLQLGKTPVVADLKRKGNHRIKIELEGYQPYEVMLSRSTSGWVFGNIIFGGIPGLIVDVVTGAMYILKPEQIQAELKKQGASFTLSESQMLITVTMSPDPTWQKIGDLTKIEIKR